MKWIAYLKDNPVIVLDLVKYILAGFVLFGLPIPQGFDVIVAGAVLTVLTVITRSRVARAIEDALHTPPPGDES